MCHNDTEQLNKFIKSLDNESLDIFIHVDKKSNMAQEIVKNDNVHILPDEYRVNVKWSDISQVDATLNLIKSAKEFDNYDYYLLASGQDYLVKRADELVEFLENSYPKNFINFLDSENNGTCKFNHYDKRNSIYYPRWMLDRKNILRVFRRAYVELTGGYNRTFGFIKRRGPQDIKFYFGSQWWCLTDAVISNMLKYLSGNEEYYKYYLNCAVPDESFFQTLFMNIGNSEAEDSLHYIDWSNRVNSPKDLETSDYDKIKNSNKFFARKFKSGVSDELIKMIDDEKTN